MKTKISYFTAALFAIFAWGSTDASVAEQANKESKHAVEDHQKFSGSCRTGHDEQRDFQDAEKGTRNKPDSWGVPQANAQRRLFKVTERIYQVRGREHPNMTIIEGKEGIMIIAPLIPEENLKEGLELYYREVEQPEAGKRPVKAIIDACSHVGRSGGPRGASSGLGIKSGKTRIPASEGCLKRYVSAHVNEDRATEKRPERINASAFNKSSHSLKAAISGGSVKVISPADTIAGTGKTQTIDGIEMEFMRLPGTEGSFAMLMYFPQFKAIFYGEDTAHAIHDIYTLRRTKARNARNRWKMLDQAIQRYGNKAEVLFTQRHCPRMGKESIRRFLSRECRGCKYMHDRALNLVSKGYSPEEIAGKINLIPESGGITDNTPKSIEQRNCLPSAGSLRRHVMFPAPQSSKLGNLARNVLKQFGYQTESGFWRNVVLINISEPGGGLLKTVRDFVSTGALSELPPELLFDYMGVCLNSEKSKGKKLDFNWIDQHGKPCGFWIENEVLMYREGEPVKYPDAVITGDKLNFALVAMQAMPLKEALHQGVIRIEGNTDKFKELLECLDKFHGDFPILAF